MLLESSNSDHSDEHNNGSTSKKISLNALSRPATMPRPKTALRRKADILMLAALAFQSPLKNHRTKFAIPKDSLAWLEYLTLHIRKQLNIEYLDDKYCG